MPHTKPGQGKIAAISPQSQEQLLNQFAERYVRLALAVGQHDSYYVDAYYGPEQWQKETYWQPIPELLQLQKSGASELTEILHKVTAQELVIRGRFLEQQWSSIGTYLSILQGSKLSFSSEASALYDTPVTASLFGKGELHHQKLLAEIDRLVPGEGALSARFNQFKSQFIVPKDKAAAVFSAAVEIARNITNLHMQLPTHESFEIEYVNDQVWTAYNWYKGNSHSLIQLNQDQPLGIERYLELASHEGYPGHHVFNVLQEQKLVGTKQWLEYAIYPLYSPISYLSEGSANYALSLIMSDEEVLSFERDVLMPLAGLSGDLALFHKVLKLVKQLTYYENYVCQQLTDNCVDSDTAEQMLVEGALYPESRAKQRVQFFLHNRAYVINYNVGEDAVAAWVEARANNQADKWTRFEALLSRPLNASDLQV
ncbi:hypothetical protein [Shewanella pneumatophori]|uniref:DUF885 domain-containing protein n=1 Tax=Shewanella pneumatophori TaxID=314092 RepID=A0A9X1ZBR3_9GAMM|nr:hypothetical protein [Shewanella pneumatophori]MCL1138117.1 hypothetical protein [Shewanella pneumatophori]